jgi:hypothetical protein
LNELKDFIDLSLLPNEHGGKHAEAEMIKWFFELDQQKFDGGWKTFESVDDLEKVLASKLKA